MIEYPPNYYPQSISEPLRVYLAEDYQIWAVNPADGRATRIVQADDEGLVEGPRGSLWFTGRGPPPNIIPGSQPQDLYLDLASGNIWQVY